MLNSKAGKSILSWLTALLVLVSLVLVSVRLLLFPWFTQVEYHMPGFPDDRLWLHPRAAPGVLRPGSRISG